MRSALNGASNANPNYNVLVSTPRARPEVILSVKMFSGCPATTLGSCAFQVNLPLLPRIQGLRLWRHYFVMVAQDDFCTFCPYGWGPRGS